MRIKTVSILGCGWYGLELAKALIQKGYTVKGSSTTVEKLTLFSTLGIQPYLIDFQQDSETYHEDFFKSDLLLISIPPKRSTNEQSTFLDKIKKISGAAEKHGSRQVVFISSTSVYGDHNTEVTVETQTAPDTDSGVAMVAAEQFLQEQTNFTTTIIRFAGLIGPGRNPGRFFAGKQEVPNGKAPVNLVHLNDCIGFTIELIKTHAFGHIYNICTPHHPSRQEFYTKAAQVSNLDTPSFKDELLNWKIIESSEQQKKTLNYQYRITNFSTWFENNMI